MKTTPVQKALLVFVFFASLFPFTYKRNTDWQGDDDYLCFYDSAVYSNLQLLPDEFSKAGLVRFGKRTVKPFLNAPHNLMPAMVYGLAYRVMDWVGAPFSTTTIQSPIAILSALTCALFFLLLVRIGLGTPFAVIGAVLLILSPIFAMATRATTTSWGASVVFSQIVALLALDRLSDRTPSKVFAGLALLNVVLTDNLFFLALPALAVAYALREVPVGQTLLSPKNLLRSVRENLKPLRAKVVFLPPALAAAWWVGTTLYAVLAERSGFWRPITPLFRLSPHTREGGSLLFTSPIILHDYAAMFLGEAFPYVFIIAIVLYWVIVRKPIQRFVWSYAAVGGMGYGILFYVLTADIWQKKNLYQIYLLVPVLLLFLFICRGWIEERPRHRIAVYGVSLLLIVSAGFGHLSYIWHKPFCLSSGAYSDWIHGANWPNAGTKAVGCFMREILQARLAQDPSRPIKLSVVGDARWVHQGKDLTPVTSLLVFSGLMADGEYFKKRLGVKPNVTLERSNEALENDLRLRVVLDFRQNGGDSGESKCEIRSDGQLIAVLVVQPADGEDALPRAGTYALHDLERKFDATYRTLEDFFPAPYSKPKR